MRSRGRPAGPSGRSLTRENHAHSPSISDGSNVPMIVMVLTYILPIDGRSLDAVVFKRAEGRAVGAILAKHRKNEEAPDDAAESPEHS